MIQRSIFLGICSQKVNLNLPLTPKSSSSLFALSSFSRFSLSSSLTALASSLMSLLLSSWSKLIKNSCSARCFLSSDFKTASGHPCISSVNAQRWVRESFKTTVSNLQMHGYGHNSEQLIVLSFKFADWILKEGHRTDLNKRVYTWKHHTKTTEWYVPVVLFIILSKAVLAESVDEIFKCNN